MAGLTPAHLLIILFIALIVIGPGKLPEVGAAVGKSLREFKRATGDLQENLTGSLNGQPPTPAQAQAPLPAAYPPQAPYQPAAYPPQAPYQPVAYPPQAPYQPVAYPPQAPYQPVAYPPQAPYQPATGVVVEPPPTPRVG